MGSFAETLEWVLTSSEFWPDVWCIQETRLKSPEALKQYKKWMGDRKYALFSEPARSTGPGPTEASAGVGVAALETKVESTSSAVRELQ